MAYVVALVDVQVSIHVALVCSPDGTGHAGPGLLECQDTLDIVTSDFLARDGINDGGLNAKEGQRGTARLGGGNTTQRCNDVGTSLGLPVSLSI